MKKLTTLIGMFMLALFSLTAHAQVSLTAVDYSLLPGNKMQIQLTLSGPAPEASSFTINDPPRLAIDLMDTRLALAESNIPIESNLARQIRAVEAGGKTRLVLSMVNMVPYEIRQDGNHIYINLNTESSAPAATAVASRDGVRAVQQIADVDFRRGDSGEGNIIITLSDPASLINVSERSGKTQLDFINVSVPDKLIRRLDVKDFATPVSFIDLYPSDAGARMVISAEGSYEHMAYQTGNSYVVSFRQLTREEEELARQDEFGYSGEKLSLNFQNIEVRAVLQLIADFTGLNVVASDSVDGNITLRLRNVPWDQALDIILETRGLGMRQTGNVMLIAPKSELAARDKADLEAQQQMVELAPLRTQFYQINYAKAAEIAELLKGEDSTILSPRGNVTLDVRTNTLMVNDTTEKHAEIARLIQRLDIAVSQVVIESRIVIAADDFSRDLGVRTGVSGRRDGLKGSKYYVTGRSTGTDEMVSGEWPPSLSSRYNVNFPVAGTNIGSLSLAVLGANYLVDMELTALQVEGRGEVVSNPRVTPSNQRTAKIEQGVEIPYLEESASGGATVSFKEALLSLEVTPQITPDDRVSMDLRVTKDSIGEIFAGVPSIETRAVETQVLVDNGDTVVLGGIYEQYTGHRTHKVPVLGDVPVLGFLFRSNHRASEKSELLIFVTPRILKEGLRTGME